MWSRETIQLLGAIASVIALIGGAVWWCVRWHIRNLRRQIRALEQKVKALEKRADLSENRLVDAQDGLRRSRTLNRFRAKRIDQLEKQFQGSLREQESLRTKSSQLAAYVRKFQEQLQAAAQENAIRRAQS